MYKYKTVARFLVSGGTATTIDYVIYRILIYISCPAIFSKTMSTIFAIICSFIINKNWTFEYSKKADKKLIFKYIIAQSINIFTNTGVNAIVYTKSNNVNFAFVCATFCGMVVNYTLQKKFVFIKK